MDDERRAEIEWRLATATSGPWRTGMLYNCNVQRDVIADNVAVCHINRSELGTEQEALDADFIANAPADIRDLLDANAALAQELAQELAALHALLAGAPELLERAAEMAVGAHCSNCPARADCPAFTSGTSIDCDTWPCYTASVQLRELAQGLRAFATVPEAGAEAEAGDRRGLAVAVAQGEEEE